ncbi:MAG: hypothetical protein ACOYVD_07025 [Bacillota bacterium]
MDINELLGNKAGKVKEQYHLCCYDPAMWLEKGTAQCLLDLINGEEDLHKFWTEKPVGNGPWSWPLDMLSPQQVDILKKRFWKEKKVSIYYIYDDALLDKLINDPQLTINYVAKEKMLFIYSRSDKEFRESLFIDDLKSINDFYEILEEYCGRFILFDVEKRDIFITSTLGPFGSYTLAYENLGRKGCRNYTCVYKCPILPLNDHLKKLTSKVELVIEGLTSEVRGIILYDKHGNIIANLNDEGEFEEV